jgi:hypothetical protein
MAHVADLSAASSIVRENHLSYQNMTPGTFIPIFLVLCLLGTLGALVCPERQNPGLMAIIASLASDLSYQMNSAFGMHLLDLDRRIQELNLAVKATQTVQAQTLRRS